MKPGTVILNQDIETSRGVIEKNTKLELIEFKYLKGHESVLKYGYMTLWLTNDKFREVETTMSELNPNHGVTQELHDHWHKIAALLMMKFGTRYVTFTTEDVEKLSTVPETNIVFEAKGKELYLSLVDDKTALELARKEGGLPH